MAFYKTKGWYSSKTVWTGLVGAVIGVLGLFGVPLPIEMSETIVSGILAVVGVLAVLFRFDADSAVNIQGE